MGTIEHLGEGIQSLAGYPQAPDAIRGVTVGLVRATRNWTGTVAGFWVAVLMLIMRKPSGEIALVVTAVKH